MKRYFLPFGSLGAAVAAEPSTGDEVRQLAVALEVSRADGDLDCRVLVSSGLPDKDRQACDLARPSAGTTPRRVVVGFWHIPDRPDRVVRAKPAGRLGATLTSEDGINPTQRPLHLHTRYVVNEAGRVERCAAATSVDNPAAVARAWPS